MHQHSPILHALPGITDAKPTAQETHVPFTAPLQQIMSSGESLTAQRQGLNLLICILTYIVHWRDAEEG